MQCRQLPLAIPYSLAAVHFRLDFANYAIVMKWYASRNMGE